MPKKNKQECPFCKNKNIFETDFSKYDKRGRVMFSVKEQLWDENIIKKIIKNRIEHEKKRRGMAPEIRRLKKKTVLVHPGVFESQIVGHYHHVLIKSDYVADRWKDFRIEIYGITLSYDPPIPSVPLFWANEKTIYAGAKITHKTSGVKVLVHWWHTHGIIVTDVDVNSLDTLKTSLSLFSRGMGRPLEHFSNNQEFNEVLENAIKAKFESLSLEDKEVIKNRFEKEYEKALKTFNKETKEWLLKEGRMFSKEDVEKETAGNKLRAKDNALDSDGVVKTVGDKITETSIAEEIAGLTKKNNKFSERTLIRWLNASEWVNFEWKNVVHTMLRNDLKKLFGWNKTR